MRFLPDVNVLIALALPKHVHHRRAHSWFRQQPNRLWATCALTQASFVRVASRALGGGHDAVPQALAGLERDCLSPLHQYWSTVVDLRDLSESERGKLIGPNQVTDMQLLLLANHHRGQLATFDLGLRELASGTRYAKSLLIL